MTYRNPITTLGLPTNLLPSSFELHRIKKRLLAEFEIQEAARIDFNGESFDRQEVLALLDSLKQAEVWSYHIRIAKQPRLLAFLTTGELELFRDQHLLEELAKRAKDEEFKGFWQFLAPYFATQFDEQLHAALRYQAAGTAQTLLSKPLPLSEAFLSSAYRKAYRFLRQEVLDLEELSDSYYRFIKERRLEKQYLGEEKIKTLNLLPNYFASLRSEYALKFEDISYKLYQDLRQYRLGRRLIQKALQIEVSEAAQIRLNYLAKQMGRNSWRRSPVDFGAKKSTNKWTSLIIGLLIVFLLLRILFWLASSASTIRNVSEREVSSSQSIQPYKYGGNSLADENLGGQRPISKESERAYELQVKEELIFLFDESERPNEGQERPAILQALLQYHNKNLSEELPHSLHTDFNRPGNLPTAEGLNIYDITNESQFDIVLFIAAEGTLRAPAIYFLPRKESTRINSTIEPGKARMFFYAGQTWISELQFDAAEADKWIGIFAYVHACDPNGQPLRYNKLRFFP